MTLCSEVIQLLSMVGVLIGLAFGLSERDFGLYSGALAAATILATASRLGTQAMVMRAPSVPVAVGHQWQRSLSVVYLGAAVATIAMIALQPLLLPGVTVLECIGLVLMQALGFVVSELGVSAGLAERDANLGLATRTIYAVGRLVGLIGFLVLGDGGLTSAVLWVSGAALISLLPIQTLVRRRLRAERSFARPTREDFTRGAGFMANDGAAAAATSMDRPLLVRFGYTVDAGTYNLGYRLAQMAALPVQAFIRVTAVDYFLVGKQRPADIRRLTTRLTGAGLALGLAAGVIAFVGADLIPVLLGDRFDAVPPVVRWLAPLPALLAVQTMPANALSGLDRQGLRNYCLLFIAGVNLILNLSLIPVFGWRGAAAATLLTEGIHVVILWGAMYTVTRQHNGSPAND